MKKQTICAATTASTAASPMRLTDSIAALTDGFATPADASASFNAK
jgi:hypothetical protein